MRPMTSEPTEARATTTEVRTANGHSRAHDDYVSWEGRSRIVLQPIAAPSILGLFGFAGATFIVAAWMAGWYGSAASPLYLFPFAALFGGLAQFTAGVWAYRARDGLATAMHGTWGAFWMGWGLLYLLVAAGTLADPGKSSAELGFWFIALGTVTLFGAIAALAENVALFAVLFTLASGSILAAIAMIGDLSSVLTAAGWVLVFSAIFAFYTAGAMMLQETFGRTVLPLVALGRARRHGPDTPIQYEWGMPGAKRGQ